MVWFSELDGLNQNLLFLSDLMGCAQQEKGFGQACLSYSSPLLSLFKSCLVISEVMPSL